MNTNEIVAALRLAHEDTCSLHCLSVWKTANGPPPHSERCQAVSAAIAAVEAALAPPAVGAHS